MFGLQILYHADNSLIVMGLNLKPGAVVVESGERKVTSSSSVSVTLSISGTGSGSLTTTLARTIAPHGHVHTFEFNLDRVYKAREDFANNKLSDLITVRHRNVCADGFPMVEGGA